MKGYVTNIEKKTLENDNFREVLYTSKHSQLVLMTLRPKEEIGMEVHPDNDQFFRFEKGQGKCIIDGNEYELRDGVAVVVPAGAQHNIINTSNTDELKLYTIYSPAHHKDGIVRPTKKEAETNEAEFDGATSEYAITREYTSEFKYCPNCGSKIVTDNSFFCSHCGRKLPKMENTGDFNIEQASFDTNEPFQPKSGGQVQSIRGRPVKGQNPLVEAIRALLFIAFIIGIIFFVRQFLDGGKVRNCIASVLGNPPECSDCDNVSRNTTMNGRSIGKCIPTHVEGDMCNLDCGGTKY